VTTYILGWSEDDHDPSGQHTLRVSTPEQVDTALEHIAADGGVYQVDIYQEVPDADESTPPYGFQVVWGHPERAAMTWLGEIVRAVYSSLGVEVVGFGVVDDQGVGGLFGGQLELLRERHADTVRA
jgi:hypothetical protein